MEISVKMEPLPEGIESYMKKSNGKLHWHQDTAHEPILMAKFTMVARLIVKRH